MRPFQTLSDAFAWFKYPPALARSLLIPFLGFPILMKLNFVRLYSVLFSWKLIFKKGQIWRLGSSFFIAPLNINLFFDSFLRYQALSQLEFMTFGKHDGIAFLVFGFIFSIFFALLDGSVIILTPVFTMYIVYVWSMLNPDIIIQFYFVPLKSKYFPWALLAVNSFIFDKYFPSEMAGILIGNLYVALFKWSVTSKMLITGTY